MGSEIVNKNTFQVQFKQWYLKAHLHDDKTRRFALG